MDGMHSIGIHIIGKPAATTNTGYDHYIFPGDPQPGHDLLHLRQDRIIPATRTPANFLVGSKIFSRQGLRRGRCGFPRKKYFFYHKFTDLPGFYRTVFLPQPSCCCPSMNNSSWPCSPPGPAWFWPFVEIVTT